MQFAQMRGSGRYTKEVNGFTGGLNTQEPPEFLDDRSLPDCLNVYWKEGALRTRPALHAARDADIDAPVIVAAFETGDSEYLFLKTPTYLLVYHRGDLILKEGISHVSATQHALFTEDGQGCVRMFLTEEVNGDVWRRVYTVTLDGDTATVDVRYKPYAPLVFVNGRGSTDSRNVGSMQMYEGFNLLTTEYRALWTTDGEATYFRPPFAEGDGTFTAAYTHTDGAVYTFSVYCSRSDLYDNSEVQEIPDVGKVYLRVDTLFGHCSFRDYVTHSPVALPEVGFSGNLAVSGNRAQCDEAAVFDMSFSTWFGGDNGGYGGGTRLFLGGNANEPHLVRYSDVNEPLYFPENNYFYVGERSQAVTAFGKQNGALVIFKERELYYGQYAYQAVGESDLAAGNTVDVTAAAYFPLTQLHPAVGCDQPHTVRLVGNRLVWATSAGVVYMLSALDAWSEKAVRCISYAVAPILKGRVRNAAAALYHDNYLLFCGDEVFLFDFMTGGFTGFTSYADDRKAGQNIPWFHWRLPFSTLQVLGRDDAMTMVATDETGLLVARFGDGARDNGETTIESRIVTKPFALGQSTRRKSVYALWLQLAHTGAAVQVSLYGEGMDRTPTVYTAHTASGDDGCFSPVAIPCRQTRVRTLGVSITAAEPLALAGITMEFCALGAVR